MALLPSFPSVDCDDPQLVRERLVALRGAPSRSSDPADSDAGDRAVAEPGLGSPRHTSLPGDDAVRAATRAGRLVQRWVPAPLRNARWEPGRPGALVLSFVAALAAVIAAIGVWRERPVPEPAPVLPLITTAAAKAPSAPPPPQATELVISVVGRVPHPGLIHLPDGARVADALAAAGGVLPGSDLMGLNVARRLADGEQLLVGVAPPPGQPVTDHSGSPGAPHIVNLNTATLEELDTLPGVGTVTAQRILDWRVAHGRFTSVDQLREVSGIGQARLAQLKHLLWV
ncbi:MAG TPA: ComEA family DNA-binding protein [Pseudonocardiaceae bacterium]|nr:ComEA family DNA-binding protein [Pseudonocardiaceae bacterium]